MTDFQSRRDAVLFAEARAQFAHRVFEERRRALKSKTRLWLGPVALLSALWVGWRVGVPSARAASSSNNDVGHRPRQGEEKSSGKRRTKPSALGLLSLFLSGSRAVPFVLPLALSWLDKRHAARSLQSGSPIAVPTWMVLLRGVSSVLRR